MSPPVSTPAGIALGVNIDHVATLRQARRGRYPDPLRAAELAAWLPVAAAHYHFDPTRIVAAGFSNGANIAGGLVLLSPGTLAGAILFRAMVPLVPEPLPVRCGKAP